MKKIPAELVKKYIEAQIALEKQTVAVESLKLKLRRLDSKGYENPLLHFEENISFRPNWKKVVDELTTKYMTQGAKSIFFNRTLKKRFPPTHGKKKIQILAPRYEVFKESIMATKKKLGLVTEGE